MKRLASLALGFACLLSVLSAQTTSPGLRAILTEAEWRRAGLDRLTPDWLVYEADDRGNPITWVIVMPTQRELAERFLRKEVNERELLDLTKPEAKYGALYLCSAITVPEHRGEGRGSNGRPSATA